MALFTKLTFENLHDPKRYEFQIDKVFTKMKQVHGIGSLFETKQENVPFFSFGYDRRNLAKILAQTVKKEDYIFSPHQQYTIQKKNKERIIYHFTPTDKIVAGVLAALLTDMLRPFLSDRVYSYRKRIMAKDEVADLSHYIVEQRKLRNIRGFYFFQTDISSYSDEILITDSSPFWEQLREYFHILKVKPSAYHWYLIRSAIRPEYYDVLGSLQQSIKGLPTGSPITPFIYNHYATKVDHLFTHIPSMFYARYSDDIILCDPNPDKVLIAEKSIHETIKPLGLKLSDKKTFRYFLNPAGKDSLYSDWKGTNYLNLLGHSVNAHGAYTLSIPRQHKFLNQTRARILNTISLLGNQPLDFLGPSICDVVNQYYIDRTSGNNLAITAVQSSNDRKTLAHLDYLVALFIAEKLSGIRGVRAFRKIPYKQIRDNWGLLSLLYIKDNIA